LAVQSETSHSVPPALKIILSDPTPLPAMRPMTPIDREFHVPAIGELEVASADIKPASAAAAFHDITRPGRKSAGKSMRSQMHETPPGWRVWPAMKTRTSNERSVLDAGNVKSLWKTVEIR
jgi:hypothetical protein